MGCAVKTNTCLVKANCATVQVIRCFIWREAVFLVAKSERGALDSVGHPAYYTADVWRVCVIVCRGNSKKNFFTLLDSSNLTLTFIVSEAQDDVSAKREHSKCVMNDHFVEPHLFGSCREVMDAPTRMHSRRTPLPFSRLTNSSSLSISSSAQLSAPAQVPRHHASLSTELRMRAVTRTSHTHTIM